MRNDPMIKPANGPNYQPQIKYREENGVKITNFIGWRLIPVHNGSSEQEIVINPKIPASSRPIPRPWKNNTMFPDKKPGKHRIPGTGIWGTDGSGDQREPVDSESVRGMIKL
jgi:hypothetical protein